MDKFTVSKMFSIDYSHRLHLLRTNHKCRNLHGHTGRITFTLESTVLNEFGFVKDFNDFNFMNDWINSHLDHAIIIARSDEELISIAEKNNMKYYVMDGLQSTSEVIAYHLLNVFSANLHLDELILYSLIKVDFSETLSSIASVSRGR